MLFVLFTGVFCGDVTEGSWTGSDLILPDDHPACQEGASWDQAADQQADIDDLIQFGGEKGHPNCTGMKHWDAGKYAPPEARPSGFPVGVQPPGTCLVKVCPPPGAFGGTAVASNGKRLSCACPEVNCCSKCYLKKTTTTTTTTASTSTTVPTEEAQVAPVSIVPILIPILCCLALMLGAVAKVVKDKKKKNLLAAAEEEGGAMVQEERTMTQRRNRRYSGGSAARNTGSGAVFVGRRNESRGRRRN